MMNWPAKFLTSFWGETFIGAVVICLLIWFFGPLLGLGSFHPFATPLERWITIAALVLLWVIVSLVHELREKKKEKELEEGVSEAKEEENAAEKASAEELALLSEKMKEALAQLKRAKLGGKSRRSVYQLPWYLFIGPPGSGKTTALVNCGLRFPLADKDGPHAVKGVGGTRHCDWWFTDEAVLIDTAGRYTTQDSDAAVDAASWMGFLKLLKKQRPRQPLNGVLVAISLSDLATQSEVERLAHARAVRKRVRELSDELGVRVPVYVLFTKADLVVGFVEFFDNLGKEEREQVWGTTYGLDDGKSEAGTVGEFGTEFDRLMQRLNERMMERVHQEPDLQRRRMIWGFPQQLASLREIAAEFLTEAFRPSRLEARALLRGVYFTSGTQDGTPIDRLLGAMAGRFGLQRQAVAAFSGSGRSYFLSRLVGEVIFGEAGLVSRDPKVERRQKLIAWGSYATAGVVLLGLLAAWTVSWFSNRDVMAGQQAAMAKYRTQYAQIVARGPNDTNLLAVLPALETLRTMPGGYAGRNESVPWSMTFGLYQGTQLRTAADQAYANGLDGLLLPRLLSRLEAQMQANLDKPGFLYQALEVYLILGRQGPLDPALVRHWMALDAAASFPGEDNAPVREAMAQDVAAMLRFPLPAIPLNGPLVAEVRGVLTRKPFADYLYSSIIDSQIARKMEEWTVAAHSGPAGSRVFRLRDGKPLDTGVPGIFTWEGYHKVFLPLIPTVTRQASQQSWVLGREGATSPEALTKLRHDVLSLYLDDYTRRWDAMLANIALQPFTTLSQGQNELFLLSAPDSPLRDLLKAIDEETQLSHPAGGEAHAETTKTVREGLTAVARERVLAGLGTEEAQIAGVLGEAFGHGPQGKPIDPAKRVDEHFKDLHEFVSGKSSGSPHLDDVIAKIQQIYQGINQAANSANSGQALLGMVAGGAAASGGGAAGGVAALAQVAQTVPRPIGAMLATVSQSSSAVTASGASTELSQAWQSKVLPLCKEAFNRYPLIAGSSQDVPLGDFTHLLGPDGLIQKFFNKYLQPLVDTTSTPWKWQSPNHAQLGLAPGALAEFERADEIRQALFPDGAKMQVKFQLSPVSADAGVGTVRIQIGTQTLTYAHGPVQPVAMTWPGTGDNLEVRVIMTPANGGPATVIENSGPWSLLRLLDAAHVIRSGAPDRFQIVFSSPQGNATFQLNADSVRNPFNMAALRAFRCPPKL
ncbi:MAG: type VI secretion system membrane subunit TssM [Rhodospirillales bacterium]|nr:type VI secretion system membrane subunit TssM [Rhodospirillales bacterium]